jgi:hypothetical protein
MRALEKIRAEIRQGLEKNGTDVRRNDADLFGDGDQSSITGTVARQQFYRDLYATGGDINVIADVPSALSAFATACIVGHIDNVRKMLQAADTDPVKPSKQLLELLERRETTQRLSPLMMIVSIGKNVQVAQAPLGNEAFGSIQLEAVKLLLEYGARPDARDVCGKTVCHYGLGAFATDMTMTAAGYCIAAHQSSHFFNKEVELHSLQKAELNGLRAICRGYVVATGRRSVYLLDRKQTVALKPENLKLVDGDDESSSSRPKLCDIPDRLGCVSLMEVLMQERVDVATVLLDQHNARSDIVNAEGLSPKQMAITAGVLSKVGHLIVKHGMRQSRDAAKEEKNACSKCGKTDVHLSKCSLCRSVQYCSRECQVSHWKKGGHKQICEQRQHEMNQTVVLEPPPPRTDGMVFATLSAASMAGRAPMSPAASGTFRKPKHVNIGEQFYIKIQGGGPQMPLMIYDQTREFQTMLEPTDPGFEVLRAKVVADPNANGRKTYLKCSFDKFNKCTVYLGSTSAKLW